MDVLARDLRVIAKNEILDIRAKSWDSDHAGIIEFCKRLLHGAARPVFLIVDGHPSHKATKVVQWIEQQKGDLRLFFLPGYRASCKTLNSSRFAMDG